MNFITSLLLLIFMGYLPALALTNSYVLATAFFAPISVAIAALGALIGVGFGTTVNGSTLAISLVVLACSCGALLQHRKAKTSEIKSPALNGSALAVWLGLLCAVLLVLLLFPAKPAWDPSTMWWFHSQWLSAGGQQTQHAMSNPYFFWAHVDYPEGVSSLIAFGWMFIGSHSYPFAQSLNSVLTGTALAGLTSVLLSRWRTVLGVAAALGLELAACGIGTAANRNLPSYGSVDVLMATLLALAVATPVMLGFSRRSLTLSAVALLAATEVKAEALVFGVIVVVALWIAAKGLRRFALITYAVAYVPSLLWLLVSHIYGRSLTSDITPGDLLSFFSFRTWDRFLRVSPPFFRDSGYLALTAIGALAVLFIAQRVWAGQRSPSIRWSATWLLAIVAAGVVIETLVVYSIGNRSLAVWIPNSLSRVVATPDLLGASFLVVIAASLRWRQSAPADDSPSEVDSIKP